MAAAADEDGAKSGPHALELVSRMDGLAAVVALRYTITTLHRVAMQCFRKAGYAWRQCQVELKGDYSVERLIALDAYGHATPLWHTVAVLFATIVPCLLAIVVLESFPLAPIEDGIQNSHNFWYRTTIGTYLVTHSMVAQFRHGVPDPGLSTKQTIVISAITTALLMPVLIGLNLVIGFPMPFFIAISVVVWSPTAATISWVVLRRRLQQNPQIVAAVKKHANIFNVQTLLIVVYPVYSYVFTTNPELQTWLALLLPVMKLILKNLFGFASQHLQDAKPELVVFNVEIFSALYVSSCTRSATTSLTTAVIMAVDFLQACLSIKDLYDVLDDPVLKQALGGLPTRKLIPLSILILEQNRPVYDHPSIPHCPLPLASANILRVATRMGLPTRGWAIVPAEGSRVQPPGPRTVTTIVEASLQPVNGRDVNTVRSFLKTFSMQQRAKTTTDRDELHRIVARLSEQEQLFVVQKTLRILHIAEFIALVEYAEVFVPLVYSLFCIIAYTFPNGKFYTIFAGQSGPDFLRSLKSVLLYGSLELVSLVALEYVVRSKFHVSALRQTAFVLETQWALVQSKLTLWMLLVLQFALPHYGFDFSFQFKWLKH